MSMPLPIQSPNPNPAANGCRLVAADGRELPLRSVDLTSHARGGLSRTTVRQVFHNASDETLQLTYQLPLPADGAVIGFSFTLGGQKVLGRVDRKADAREAFESAVLEGRTAALLEQERSSLFHQDLGNVPPGAEVHCEIEVEHLLAWRSGGWEWRFPTVVAPRFTGTETVDPSRVSVDVLDGDMPARCTLALTISDRCTAPPSSPSHIVTDQSGTWVLGAGARLDRDVVLRWSTSTEQVEPQVSVFHGPSSSHAMVTVVPPTPEAAPDPVARDLILLLDISGSMAGRPLGQLKAFSRALVESLSTADRLEMIGFAAGQQRWSNAAVTMTPRAKAEAVDWLDRLQAGGGTWMHEAIIAALQPLRSTAQRQVVLITDGLIGFEEQVIGAIRKELPEGSRVHTIGVGSGVNRSLLGPAARAGAGVEIVVGLDEAVDTAVSDLLARTSAPLIVDLSLRGQVLREVAPMRVPDLFAGAPMRLWLEIDPAGGPLEIRGKAADGPWAVTVDLPSETTGARGIQTRFARERVEDLELELAAGGPASEIDASIEALGLLHQIATRHTSWIAETEQSTVDASNPIRRVAVPQQLPHGMSAEAVGLRASMPHAPVRRSTGVAVMFSQPAPPQARRRQAKAKRAPGLLDLAAGMIGKLTSPPAAEEAEAIDVNAPAPAAPEGARRASGVIRLLRRGTLVMELDPAEDGPWDPEDLVEIELSDGTRHQVPVQRSSTTAAGAFKAGSTIRLVLSWDGDRPIRVWASGLEIEIQ